MDMRTGASLYADPRRLVACAAGMDLTRWYGFDRGFFHMGPDANFPGVQAVAERVFTAMLSLFLWRHPPSLRMGVLGPSGSLGSLVQMMIDEELFGMIDGFLRGLEVTEETLALDEILGKARGGDFLSDPHTAEHFRGASWLPRLFERELPQVGDTLTEQTAPRAKRRLRELLAVERARPLDDDRQRELDAILRDACKAFGVPVPKELP